MSSRIGRAVMRPAAASRALQQKSSPTTLISRSATATRQYATTPAPAQLGGMKLPEDYVSPLQPPSARQPQFRKSQLLRSYTSMLRSTPLMLLFQHNNLTAVEWSAVRRELRAAIDSVPAPAAAGPDGAPLVDASQAIRIQTVRTNLFDMALRIVEFYDPKDAAHQSNAYTHDLSTTVYDAVRQANVEDPNSIYMQLKPLLAGGVAALTFPTVSPAHLAAALKVLAPSKAFPAPTRRKFPGWHDATAQAGLQKLFMLGGRVEGKVFDGEGVNWVGGIEGGIEGLRAQLVGMLNNAGLGLTTALEGHGKGLWLTLESRRSHMEEEANGGSKGESKDS